MYVSQDKHKTVNEHLMKTFLNYGAKLQNKSSAISPLNAAVTCIMRVIFLYILLVSRRINNKEGLQEYSV